MGVGQIIESNAYMKKRRKKELLTVSLSRSSSVCIQNSAQSAKIAAVNAIISSRSGNGIESARTDPSLSSVSLASWSFHLSFRRYVAVLVVRSPQNIPLLLFAKDMQLQRHHRPSSKSRHCRSAEGGSMTTQVIVDGVELPLFQE